MGPKTSTLGCESKQIFVKSVLWGYLFEKRSYAHIIFSFRKNLLAFQKCSQFEQKSPCNGNLSFIEAASKTSNFY